MRSDPHKCKNPAEIYEHFLHGVEIDPSVLAGFLQELCNRSPELVFNDDPDMCVVSYVGEKQKSAMRKMNDPTAKLHTDVAIPQRK